MWEAVRNSKYTDGLKKVEVAYNCCFCCRNLLIRLQSSAFFAALKGYYWDFSNQLSRAVFPRWGIWHQSSARGGKFVTYRFLNFYQFKKETLSWYMYINIKAY